MLRFKAFFLNFKMDCFVSAWIEHNVSLIVLNCSVGQKKYPDFFKTGYSDQ